MKIIIVDDDKIVAVSLKTILEATGKIEVLELGGSGEEAVELFKIHRPDVILMDIRMNGMTGLQAGEKILAEDNNAKILYLTTFADDEYIGKALEIGAKGYILKQDFEGIAPALETVMSGQTVFGEAIISRMHKNMNRERRSCDYLKYDLNEKEMQLIELVAEGLSNKEIASDLFLSEGTVRNYLSAILEKLNLRDRTQLAVFYYKKL
ncbi:MAG TPA: response regulator transcription factor [Ruminococcus sp.]